MGILAQFFNTTIINTAHHFHLERDQAKNIKIEITLYQTGQLFKYRWKDNI